MTKAECEALARLAAGDRLYVRRMVMAQDGYCTPQWANTDETLHWRTFRSIKRKGWVAPKGMPAPDVRNYDITAAGRAALQEEDRNAES